MLNGIVVSDWSLMSHVNGCLDVGCKWPLGLDVCLDVGWHSGQGMNSHADGCLEVGWYGHLDIGWLLSCKVA